MNTHDSPNIHRSIKQFRILAVTFSGLIAILTLVMISRVTSTLDSSSATKINMAGKQRVLAQRVLSDALQIDTAVRVGDWNTLEPVLLELRQSTLELNSAHTSLFLGSAEFHLAPETSAQGIDTFQAIEHPLRTITHSSNELQTLTISMIRRAPYIDQLTFDRVATAKNEIIKAHSIFSPQMNDVVMMYERDYKATIASSVRGAKIGMLILVGALIAILLFVIEPTFLIIRKQVSQLGKAINQAQRADAVRWRLLTNIGHEFRTPMNAIMGFADLLNEDTLSDSERSRLAKSIFESSTQLTSLIETMLDMSAIEAGQLRINKENCDLTQILTKLKINTSAKALSKQIEVTLKFDTACPTHISTDPKRFEQILNKITDNAIKFTQSGNIDISAGLVKTDDKQLLQITIADTGIGITPEDLSSIFDPFQQAQDTLTRKFGGAGLGLSISRDISKALGGDVAVSSKPNHGSTFTITIDPGTINAQQINPSAPTTDQSPKPLANYKLLVVDDAKDNRILLQHILKKTGASIEFAMDGQQAVDAITKAIDEHTPFDLVLMDMQMPVMDGYLATVKIREKGITTPVIAVTAHALEGDRQDCLDAGCDEYHTKPINKQLLIETCISLIDQHTSQPKQLHKAA